MSSNEITNLKKKSNLNKIEHKKDTQENHPSSGREQRREKREGYNRSMYQYATSFHSTLHQRSAGLQDGSLSVSQLQGCSPACRCCSLLIMWICWIGIMWICWIKNPKLLSLLALLVKLSISPLNSKTNLRQGLSVSIDTAQPQISHFIYIPTSPLLNLFSNHRRRSLCCEKTKARAQECPSPLI